MSDTDNAPNANTKPILSVKGHRVVHPDYVNLLPWIERKRLTWEAFLKQEEDQGRSTPSPADWARTFELTENEIDAAGAIQDLAYEGHFNDLRDYFFVRKFGNKPRVCWRQPSGLLGHMSSSDFQVAFTDRKIEIGTTKEGVPKWESLAKVWLDHPKTPRYDRVEFLPGKRPWEVRGADIYNLWAGWPEGLPRERDLRLYKLGEVPPDDDELDGSDEPEEARLFLDHIYENMCDEDAKVYNYLLGWLADTLLRPGPSETAVVMAGPSGSGKGTFAEFIGSFLGAHYVAVNDKDQVVGKFNRHLMETQLVFADEVNFSSAQVAKTLRNLVTEPTLMIEPKGVDSFQAKKWFRIMVATNDKHVMNVVNDDRRYLVLNVDGGERNQDRAYFKDMRKQWDNGGRVALFRWLTGRYWQDQLASGAWDVGQRPVTAALQAQKDMSLPPAEMVVHNMLVAGEVPCDDIVDSKGLVFVPTRLLVKEARIDPKDERALRLALRALAGEGAKSVKKYLGDGSHRRQYRGFWLPPLDDCRRRWETYLGRDVDWLNGPSDWGVVEPVEDEPVDEPPF